MRGTHGISAAIALASLATLHCGAEPAQSAGQSDGHGTEQSGAEPGWLVSVQTERQLEGSFAQEDGVLQFAAVSTAPLAGDVRLDLGALRYELHYDYDARQVVADGYGGALQYDDQRHLLAAIEAASTYLQRDGREPALLEPPLHEAMLHAALGMLRDSGGMPLERQVFDLGTGAEQGSEIDKAIGDDGIGCIESGSSYYVSFDYGETTVLDTVIQAGVYECNGQCGPYCTQLQPWRMWTLDCLEHDSCCNVTSDDACWTPLGECGDEYEEAMADFLRGYAPFSRHCGG